MVNNEYFYQLEISNLNLNIANKILSVDTSINENLPEVSDTDAINYNTTLTPYIQQINYINNMKWLRTNNFII